jgi:hypothetical protein
MKCDVFPQVVVSRLSGLRRSVRGSYPYRLFPDQNLDVSSEYARRDRNTKEDLLAQEVSLGEYDGFGIRSIIKPLDSCLELSPPFP